MTLATISLLSDTPPLSDIDSAMALDIPRGPDQTGRHHGILGRHPGCQNQVHVICEKYHMRWALNVATSPVNTCITPPIQCAHK